MNQEEVSYESLGIKLLQLKLGGSNLYIQNTWKTKSTFNNSFFDRMNNSFIS